MFQVLFQGKIVSREKIENNIYAKFCGENKCIKENVKVANREPLNKQPFTLVNNLLLSYDSDDIKWTAFSFLTVKIV